MPKPVITPAPRVRKAAKRLELSLGSLEAYVSDNGGDFNGRPKIKDSTDYVRVVIRVRRPDLPVSWAMSVLLNNQRIEGIDWEPVVHDHRGKSHDCTGWHRHLWSQTTADTLKECLPEFNPKSIREFLTAGFALLHVELKKESQNAEHIMLWD